jgi:hypothetical protein
MFNAQTRIGEDKCGLSQESIQNVSYSNYLLTNFYVNDCTMQKPIEFATTYKSMMFNAPGGTGNQCGLNGCNIDINNDLLLGSVQTHPKCKVSLFQRQFSTIPYLGRGMGNVDLETQILRNKEKLESTRKSTNPTSEIENNIKQYPMLDSIRSTITNPKYLVEGAASSDWTRGGMSTRDHKIKSGKN